MNTPLKEKEDSILTAHNIVNRFGSQVIHDGISLDIIRGEVIGIAGGSGTGKSILLKTMIGLHEPNGGEVRIADKPVADIAPSESTFLLGVLFQEGALFSSLSVAQNIMLPLREHTSLSEDEQRMLAQFKLALVGMPAESADKHPAELSGGMMRRAALARALAMDPLLLFLDEPTSGLDPLNASGFDELIRELNRSLNITVVMVTHDLDTLFTICDRVAILVDRHIIVDTLPNLLQNTHPWIKEFLHGPRGQGAAVAARSMYGNR